MQSSRFRRLLTASLALLLALAVHCAFAAAGSKGADSGKSVQEILDSKGGNPEAAMAALTDSQARELLLQKLEQERRRVEATSSRPDAVVSLLVGAQASVRRLGETIRAHFAAADEQVGAWRRVADALGEGQGDGRVVRSLSAIAAVILCALAALTALRRRFAGFIRSQCGRELSSIARVRIFLLRAFFHAMSLGVYFGVYTALMMAFMPDENPSRNLANIAFVVLTYVLVLRILAELLLSPDSAPLRPLPLGDEAARALYRWLMAITWGVALLAAWSSILKEIGGAPALATMFHASAGVFSGLVLSAMILANRERVALACAPSGDGDADMRGLLARCWHYPALAYALFVGTFWSVRALSVEESMLRLVLSMFLIPVCIGIDLWVRKILAMVSEQPVVPVETGFAEPFEADEPGASVETGAPAESTPLDVQPAGKTVRDFMPLVSRIVRLTLAAASVFLMLRIWGVAIPMGWLFARNVMGVLLVVLGSLVFWEIIRIQIDHKLRQEIALSGIDPDDMEEGGAGAGSRTATLLVLLRKFVLTVIVVMGTLVTLSSMGVDIAPLIAGAGVFGLALGFGAQTLVKDIISGIFFLIDDAFRVGDYVEAGSAKGTVEQISLRSMKLRHPRGMVYNVPYGSLKILQNFSRDFIISKLDFRIRYDADVEKIRKVIKKVNKEMQADENFRSRLLSDIKSNGVRGMEDSAMILRVKFKTPPGQQFFMQKEVYRRVQEAFRKNGIEFAHRNVTVYLPPELQALMARDADSPNPAAATAIGGAAAAAVLLQEEEEKRLAAEAAAGKKSAESDE
jgi:small-conductance mechanosensitive channel